MASEKVKTFTDNNFDDEKKSGVVLVDFWAEWCGPCRRLAPTVDALATEFDGRATVAKLNVDENPTIPERYAVRGIPTLLLFKEGELTVTAAQRSVRAVAAYHQKDGGDFVLDRLVPAGHASLLGDIAPQQVGSESHPE